jgi:hypothetical protein
VRLNVGLAALAVGLGGCGAANEDDAVRAASESDAARETKAALGDGRPSDSFGVTCKKKADKAFACTKYELDKNDPGKFSAADVLGEYETTCVKPDTCKVRVADYTPDMHRRGGP